MTRSVLLGDATTHGGVVISASSTYTVAGRPAALDGDLVSCPKRGHGVSAISASRSSNNAGRAMAMTGDGCGCGATVIGTGSVVLQK